MIRIISTFRHVLAVFCLLASLFAFSNVAAEGESLTETSAEKVLELEECKLFSSRCLRERESSSQSYFGVEFPPLCTQVVATSRFFRPNHERDRLNGSGSHLRI